MPRLTITTIHSIIDITHKHKRLENQMESELYRIIMLGVLLACNVTCLVLVYQARAQFKRDSQARTQRFRRRPYNI